MGSQGSGADERAHERAAESLDEVVALIDAGELTATSAERAYLVGSARSLQIAVRDQRKSLSDS